MKASVKLREEERKSPLLRAKVPISVLGFPFVSSITAGDPHDLAFHLVTALPAGPSLKLTYHPKPSPHSPNPFSLTIKSGIGLWGSPDRSPLLMSAHLSLPTAGSPSHNFPSFSIQIKPHFGDFSLKKTAVSSSHNPNPNSGKENGVGVHHPVPVEWRELSGLEDLLSSGVALAARTTLPVTSQAGVRLRWGVNFPARTGYASKRLPYLTVDKISIESLEEEEKEQERDEKKPLKEWDEKDLEAMKGMCFWMSREVEELKRENKSIKERIEMVRRNITMDGRGRRLEGSGEESGVRVNSLSGFGSRGMEKEGRKQMASPRDAAIGSRPSSTTTTTMAES